MARFMDARIFGRSDKTVSDNCSLAREIQGDRLHAKLERSAVQDGPFRTPLAAPTSRDFTPRRGSNYRDLGEQVHVSGYLMPLGLERTGRPAGRRQTAGFGTKHGTRACRQGAIRIELAIAFSPRDDLQPVVATDRPPARDISTGHRHSYPRHFSIGADTIGYADFELRCTPLQNYRYEYAGSPITVITAITRST